jgi:hypothetical protein
MEVGRDSPPACAGSTTASAAPAVTAGTHPRLRGEHPSRAWITGSGTDSPPLARGAQHQGCPARRPGGLTPACAGSTLRPTASQCHRGTHPRLRGEHPTTTPSPATPSDSPPLARGAPTVSPSTVLARGLTPACAGSTLTAAVLPDARETHPRLRGEHARASSRGGTTRDSPPLARGARVVALAGDVVLGLTPACAGSTSPSATPPTASRTHPRLRGEHVAPASRDRLRTDSPPLARGAPALGDGWRSVYGLTPACAGSTRTPSGRGRRGRTHPRLRGEHPASGSPSSTASSPPLARGARLHGPPRARRRGLTPACAGSTHHGPGRPMGRRTHPRLRGEHPL